jgi:hypothetical protein
MIFMVAPRLMGFFTQRIEASAANMPERSALLVGVDARPCPKKRMPAFVAPAFDRSGRKPY